MPFNVIGQLAAKSFFDGELYTLNVWGEETKAQRKRRVDKLVEPAVKKGYIIRNAEWHKEWAHWSFGDAQGNEGLALRVVVFTLAVTSRDLARPRGAVQGRGDHGGPPLGDRVGCGATDGRAVLRDEPADRVGFASGSAD